MLLAHLTDTHLLADPTADLWGHNTTSGLVAVMDALPPRVDAMVVTGDVAEDSTPEAYRRALALTEDRAGQRHFVPGNHDSPTIMQSVLGALPPLRMVPISSAWTLALVDSQWFEHDAGRIGIDTLALLRDELVAVRSHVIVGLHHPPVSPCSSPACGLTNRDELLDAIAGGPVRVVLSGHVHQQFDTTIDDIRFLGAPSTFRQLRHGGDPHYQDTHEPPGAQLLELFDDGNVLRHLVEAR